LYLRSRRILGVSHGVIRTFSQNIHNNKKHAKISSFMWGQTLRSDVTLDYTLDNNFNVVLKDYNTNYFDMYKKRMLFIEIEFILIFFLLI